MMMSSAPPHHDSDTQLTQQWRAFSSPQQFTKNHLTNSTGSDNLRIFPDEYHTRLQTRNTELKPLSLGSSPLRSLKVSPQEEDGQDTQSSGAIDIQSSDDWGFTLLSNTHMSANSEGTFCPMVRTDKNSNLPSSSLGSEVGFTPLFTGLPDQAKSLDDQQDCPSPGVLSEDGELSYMVKGVAGLLDDEEDENGTGNKSQVQHHSNMYGAFPGSPPVHHKNGSTMSPMPQNVWTPIEDGMFEFEEDMPMHLSIQRHPSYSSYEDGYTDAMLHTPYSPHHHHTQSPIRGGHSHGVYQRLSHPHPPSKHYGSHRDRSRTACKFYLQGNCKAGDHCKFSHDTSIRGSPPPVSPVMSPSLQSLSPGMEYSSLLSDDTQSLGSSASGSFSNSNGSNSPTLCKFFLQGNCKKADRCPFKHDLTKPDSKKSPPSIFSQAEASSPMASSDLASNRSRGVVSEDLASEDSDRLQKAVRSPGEQMKLCPFFINGECRYGDKCRFLHLNLDTSDERHAKLAEESKRKQSTIPCKYYAFGKGACPFGEGCFFLHIDLTDGEASELDHQPYLCCDADGNFTDVSNTTLSDFVVKAEQGSFSNPSSPNPHKKRSKRSKSRKKRSSTINVR